MYDTLLSCHRLPSSNNHPLNNTKVIIMITLIHAQLLLRSAFTMRLLTPLLCYVYMSHMILT